MFEKKLKNIDVIILRNMINIKLYVLFIIFVGVFINFNIGLVKIVFIVVRIIVNIKLIIIFIK